MTQRTQTRRFREALARVQHLFVDTPSVKLTTADAARLPGLDRQVCRVLLRTLTETSVPRADRVVIRTTRRRVEPMLKGGHCQVEVKAPNRSPQHKMARSGKERRDERGRTDGRSRRRIPATTHNCATQTADGVGSSVTRGYNRPTSTHCCCNPASAWVRTKYFLPSGPAGWERFIDRAIPR